MIRFLSLFVDAWEQLRLQRVRVLMSLIGVTVAVAALTSSVALGNVMSRVQEEMQSRSGGPAATYTLTVASEDDPVDVLDVFREITDRYGIAYATASSWFQPMLPGTDYVQGTAVDAPYFDMYGLNVVAGRAFVPGDDDRLAPVAVVTEPLAADFGFSDVSSHPTLELQDGTPLVVVGIVSGRYPDDRSLFVTPDAYFSRIQPGQPTYDDPSMPEEAGAQVDLQVSVPDDRGTEFARRIVSELRAELPGAQVDGYRSDAGAYAAEGADPAVITATVLSAISAIVLLLGALSLVNIAVVTVRYRIREFGIRRAFGASRRRIYLGVMMESVVGTFIAGAIGVGIVAVLYRSPLAGLAAERMGLFALPSFPVQAAVVGIVASVVTGAVAGMIPAGIAVRAKVIDAIRF